MKTKYAAILSALALMLLMGVGSCERKLPDSIHPLDKYCNLVPGHCAPTLWWTVDGLDPTNGLTGGIAGSAPFIIVVPGVEDIFPWNNYDQPYESTISLGVWDYHFTFNVGSSASPPPYIPMLVIENSNNLAAYNLSLLPDNDRMIGMTDVDGNYNAVKLPSISIPADESLFLYVGADGSSYYAYDDSGTHTYTRYDSYPSYMLDPPTAFANAPAASW